MRKWLWCCTAAGFVAVGVLGTVKYCRTPSDSPVTGAFISGCVTGLGDALFSGLRSGPGANAAADQGEPKQVVQIDLPGGAFPAPAAIVIRDDEDLKEPASIAEDKGGENLVGDTVPVVEWQAHPTEAAPSRKRMPYADEDTPVSNFDCQAIGLCGMWVGALGFGPCAQIGPIVESTNADCAREVTSDSGPSLWRRFIRAITGEAAGSGAAEESEPLMEGSRNHSTYHDHYPSCPFTSGCYPGRQYVPRPIPVEKPKCGGTEGSEPPKPMKVGTRINPLSFFNDNQDFLQWRPAYPRLDTMEFRPSDRRLNEYRQVPGEL
jgi:hypothetical protein